MAGKAKDGSIELLRGWAILGVLLIHTSMYFKYVHAVNLLVLANIVIDIMAHFAVPLFIFISGFVLARNYPGSFHYLRFYKNRFRNTLPPYLLSSIFYCYLFHPNISSMLTMIKYIITFNASFHLWFFKALFGMYIFYPVIRKVYEHFMVNFQYKKLLFGAVILQLLWTAVNDFPVKHNFVDILLFGTTFLGWIVYFLLGMIFFSYKDLIVQCVLKNKFKMFAFISMLIIPITTAWIDVFYGEKNYMIALSRILLELVLFTTIITYLFAISNTLYQSDRLLKRGLLYLGKYSFGIYLIHVFYLRIFVNAMAPALKVDMSSLWFYVGLFLFMTVLSTLTVRVISKVPYNKLFIGETRRKLLKA